MSTVFLPSLRTFICDPDKTLLDSAKAQGVVLEYSCRSGRCGVCKAQAEGDSEVICHDESVLTPEEVAAGYILTCCRSARGDLQLHAEDLHQFEGIQVKTLPCRVDSVNLVSKDVLSVILRVPPTAEFKYLPGQYIDVIGKNGIRRSYSLANAPRVDGKLELQIRQVDQGLMSEYWFGSAAVNDLLRLEGPQGTFGIRPDIPEHLIFLATGTGIAPVKAMLEQLNQTPNLVVDTSIHVYWGGRVNEDIYWQPELSALPVAFNPVLSRAGEQWDGRTGYIQSAVIEDQIPLSKTVVYACGSDAMIHSARELLIKHGLSPKKFYSDAFVSSN
ncbi:2Fe-2S iron-sulfur cluster binding domain-containing protein [Pseudomonas lundensis]|nr:2Fe-2S iron-sulfur cluster binding domain-containing protein [Pseudomonas lundensis]